MVIALASLAAVAFGSGSVMAKRGMQQTSALGALIISSGAAAVILGVAVLLNPPEQVNAQALFLFVCAGIVGDGIARFTLLGSIDRFGPIISIPIETAIYPLVVVLAGVTLLAERVTTLQVFGVVIIIGGIWMLLVPGQASTSDTQTAQPPFRFSWAALLLPSLAGLCFALADLLRKLGLERTPEPALGALVAVATMLTIMIATSTAVPTMRSKLRVGAGWPWLLGSGAALAVALLSLYRALEDGAMSVIGPIVSAQPLVVIAVSLVLLRDIERVTVRMGVGTVLAVTGVTLVAINA